MGRSTALGLGPKLVGLGWKRCQIGDRKLVKCKLAGYEKIENERINIF